MADTKAYQHSWMDAAVCAEIPQRVFFVEEGSRPEPSKIRRAKAYCNTCPVRRECLVFAITHERAGQMPFGFAMFLVHPWEQVGRKRWRKKGPPTMAWKKFTASSTPATGIYGGSTPAERHRKHIKHVQLDQGTCIRGRTCPGCRPLDEWADMVMEVTQP